VDWVSLHSHSTYSFLDGFGQPEAHAERVMELGMNALALTEHGNVSSHVALEQAARKHGIKPIYGMEAYTAADLTSKFKWHLGLLAMNAEGYQNLMRITTQAWEDFYYESTVLGKTLSENKSGLAILSGCTGSKLASDLVGGKGRPDHAPDLRAARETAARFRDIFGDSYYLETQAFPELDKVHAINEAYERIGKELGIPLVATCDVHYCFPEDSDCQVVLHACGRGNKTFEAQSLTWEYNIPMTYPQDDLALWKRLKDTGLSRKASSEAIHNAAELAERCNVTLPRAARLRYPGTEAELKWAEVS
jgi:DNA polymerase III subunit alpha